MFLCARWRPLSQHAAAAMILFSEVTDLVTCYDSDTLWIFDIDDTLITGRDSVATWCFPSSFKRAAFNRYPQLFDDV